MSMSLHEVDAQPQCTIRDFGFHICMASVIAAVALASVIGCRFTSVVVPHWGARVIAAVLILVIFQPLPLFWHQRGNAQLRDSSFCILWAAMLWIVLPFPVDISARLSGRFPLRDTLFAHSDSLAGVHIGTLVRWASTHAAGRFLNATYLWLAPLLVVAFVVPGLTGLVIQAKRFLVANLVAFAVGLPIFVGLPAVGPWSVEAFTPRASQLQCQADVEQLRQASSYVHHSVGPICFPSFHVMWAILCAWTLFPFRRIRIPIILLAGAICISTMTSGWHYLSDAVGGVLLAAVSILIATWLIPNCGSDSGRRSSYP